MARLSDTWKMANDSVQPSWNAPMYPGADGADTAMAITAMMATEPTSRGTGRSNASTPNPYVLAITSQRNNDHASSCRNVRGLSRISSA